LVIKMCTAISLKVKDHYFGRNLDLYYNYNEQVVITPRNYNFDFCMAGKATRHFSFIGMATVSDGYPLYYDGVNEKGLGVAALNFPCNAHYLPAQKGKTNLASFEVIPFLLCNFKSVAEVEKAAGDISVLERNFSSDFPASPLHWMVSDETASLVLEPMADRLKIYKNPYGVLTNNPPFETQSLWLQNFWHLSNKNPQKGFYFTTEQNFYSLGMGAIGLPGDTSSPSRFVKAAFLRKNSVCEPDENSAVSQFFHILSSVEQVKGSSLTDNGECEYTVYSSCCNASKGIYYYTTYNNRAVSAVDMQKENLDSNALITFDLNPIQP